MQKIRIIIKKLRKEHFFLIAPLTLSVILISSVAVYLFEHDTTDSSIKTVWDGIWWAFVTICTVGYGDKFPVSNGGKIIGILLMISGIGLLSMLTATVASVLVEQKIKEGKGLETIKASNHTVICGWNGNSEEVLSGIIQQDPARDDLVVLINELPADEFDSLRLRYEKHNMIFLRGNFVHEEVLLRACVHQAKYVLLMADLSG
ncbi:MAG: potassium channel family protein, partial [Syntrophales bacterium]